MTKSLKIRKCAQKILFLYFINYSYFIFCNRDREFKTSLSILQNSNFQISSHDFCFYLDDESSVTRLHKLCILYNIAFNIQVIPIIAENKRQD